MLHFKGETQLKRHDRTKTAVYKETIIGKGVDDKEKHN
jgi:hypothetical protein